MQQKYQKPVNIMPFLKVANANIFFDSLGENSWPAVFLVNGHTRSSADFRMLSRFLKELQIRTVMIDNRGSGRTEFETEFSLEDLKSDVVAVADYLEIDVFSVLGISMGGFIALNIALTAPKRVKKLILISTTASRKWFIKQTLNWSEDAVEVREKLATYFAPDFPLRNAALFDSMVKQTQNAIISGRYLQNAKAQRAAVDYVQDLEADLNSISCETLIIHGQMDQIIATGAAEKMHEGISGSIMKIYPAIGHLILAESPRRLYDDVALFLASSTQT